MGRICKDDLRTQRSNYDLRAEVAGQLELHTKCSSRSIVSHSCLLRPRFAAPDLEHRKPTTGRGTQYRYFHIYFMRGYRLYS